MRQGANTLSNYWPTPGAKISNIATIVGFTHESGLHTHAGAMRWTGINLQSQQASWSYRAQPECLRRLRSLVDRLQIRLPPDTSKEALVDEDEDAAACTCICSQRQAVACLTSREIANALFGAEGELPSV